MKYPSLVDSSGVLFGVALGTLLIRSINRKPPANKDGNIVLE